jgi:hypothetical protein
MTLVLTQVYLDRQQKKALAARAKKSGRKTSDLVREAVDALLLGVSTEELKQLDEATKRAEADIKEMVKILDGNARQHRSFVTEIVKSRQRE